MCHEGRFISKETIRQMARSLYMMPWAMAKRAAFQLFYINRAASRIYADKECVTYTEEFRECIQDLQSELLPEEEVEPIPEAQIRLIENLRLPEANFTNAWEHTWKKVYNMDETLVRINNSKTRAIAPIGTEKVIIDGIKNEKECLKSK